MVTKPLANSIDETSGSVLAKIHMVTKRKHINEFKIQEFCSSKNSYGNKTFI